MLNQNCSKRCFLLNVIATQRFKKLLKNVWFYLVFLKISVQKICSKFTRVLMPKCNFRTSFSKNTSGRRLLKLLGTLFVKDAKLEFLVKIHSVESYCYTKIHKIAEIMLVLFYDGIFSNQVKRFQLSTDGLLRNFFEIALWHECSPVN